MYERINIIKDIYPDYLIYIRKKEKLKIIGIDKKIVKYFGKKNINYLILDNLEIDTKKEYKNNRYEKCYIKIKLIEVLKEMYNI